jgi:hypothetical protein
VILVLIHAKGPALSFHRLGVSVLVNGTVRGDSRDRFKELSYENPGRALWGQVYQRSLVTFGCFIADYRFDVVVV